MIAPILWGIVGCDDWWYLYDDWWYFVVAGGTVW
jgi:hypothetical protein